MIFRVIYEHGVYEDLPFAEAYRSGTCHLVAFAEAGRSCFKYHLIDAGFDAEEAVRVCTRINRSDRTGTVWPKANLSALPRRYFRSATVSTDDLTARFTEAFRIHCQHVRCPHIVFNFKCAVLNKARIEQTIKTVIHDESNTVGIHTVTVYFDRAEFGIGKDDQPVERSDKHEGNYLQIVRFCPLCGCRVGASSLAAHMEKRCHRKKTNPAPSPSPDGSPRASLAPAAPSHSRQENNDSPMN